MTYNSLIGFLALITYISTLIPSNLIKVFPHTKTWTMNRFLCKQRRLLELTAFALAVNHVLTSVAKHHNINFLSLDTYKTYYAGIIPVVILAILAFTYNRWSIRRLKRKWAVLHGLTYVAMFLLLWHVFTTMENQWTLLTPIALELMSMVSLLFLTRLIVTAVTTIYDKLIVSNKLKVSVSLPENVEKEVISCKTSVRDQN